MADLTVGEMQQMQRELQSLYLEKWGGLSPEKAKEKMLWMHGELGEASDLIKKRGSAAIMEDPQVRSRFVEELCDVLMYYNDILLCFDVTPEELRSAYVEKYTSNLRRW